MKIERGGRIVAVVVTRNRRAQLVWCVDCLRRQSSPPEAIVVVDNGSEDDTAEWLASQADLEVLYQENRGSAAGQASGWRRALEVGADWVWCMDDDGYPHWDALGALRQAMGQAGELWLNSMVLDSETRSQLAFWSAMPLRTFLAQGELVEHASPFNGTLLHRTLIEKIGFPCEDLFIWGDEAEYLRRAQAVGVKPITVTRSIFFHPKSRTDVPLWMLSPAEYERHYFRIRNAGARLAPDGRVMLNAREARSRAVHDLRILARELWQGPIRAWSWSLRKAWIAFQAARAAYRNQVGYRRLGGRGRL